MNGFEKTRNQLGHFRLCETSNDWFPLLILNLFSITRHVKTIVCKLVSYLRYVFKKGMIFSSLNVFYSFSKDYQIPMYLRHQSSGVCHHVGCWGGRCTRGLQRKEETPYQPLSQQTGRTKVEKAAMIYRFEK